MESKFVFSRSFIKKKAAVILIWKLFLFGLVINICKQYWYRFVVYGFG